MSSRTERPSVETLRALLRAGGWPVRNLVPVQGGLVSWTYHADGETIVQVPRFDQAVEACRTQSTLMPLVQASVPFAVLVPQRWVPTWADRSRRIGWCPADHFAPAIGGVNSPRR